MDKRNSYSIEIVSVGKTGRNYVSRMIFLLQKLKCEVIEGSLYVYNHALNDILKTYYT